MTRVKGVMNFANECRQLLWEYGVFAHETIDELVPEAADIAVKKIRATARIRTGQYERGWTKKRTKTWGYGTTYVVHNKDRYRIAHLLENKHQKANKYGKYGDLEGNGKIKEAEEYADAWLVNMVSAKLEGGGG